ncbi:protein of unknown function [Candidatus Nitrosocosmicus franklandus]|uniref:Polyphosphate kinase-2-related domain-containing protein n=1 Tax=Candidatus Nitrosocosmicus franklandianus TaxID=1798806 RepID=A0A484IAZ9_9ARCH|nr:protein of unknown function [Candidatus Nitrosocosmicus franklandus]
MLSRIQDPNKQWKRSESDLMSHKNYQKYITAYVNIFKDTNVR